MGRKKGKSSSDDVRKSSQSKKNKVHFDGTLLKLPVVENEEELQSDLESEIENKVDDEKTLSKQEELQEIEARMQILMSRKAEAERELSEQILDKAFNNSPA